MLAGRGPNRWALAWLLAWAFTGHAQADSSVAEYWHAGSSHTLVSRFYHANHHYRGDWEPVNVLLLVYEPAWENSLKLIIERTRPWVDVRVLLPTQEGRRRGFVRWSDRQCTPVVQTDLDSPWIRDYGPMQVRDHGGIRWMDFGYDAERFLDDTLPGELGRRFSIEVEDEWIRLDGGALVSNGAGLCAITDQSLEGTGLDPFDRLEIERFSAKLGCEGLAVIPALTDEITGHADVAVQFLDRHTVAIASMEEERWPQDSELLEYAVQSVQRTAKAIGQHLRVVRVPMEATGDVYFSFVNGQRVGGLYLVPSYDYVEPPVQAFAHSVLAEAMPSLELVPVPADEMAASGGAVHCITLGLDVPWMSGPPQCQDSSVAHWSMPESTELPETGLDTTSPFVD